MKIRLVAIDLDGTLLNSDKDITETTSAILRTARETAGVHVVLASARPPRTVRPFHSLLGLDTPMINYNGALVVDPHTDEILLHQAIPASVAGRVVNLARHLYPQCLVTAEIRDRWYTDRYDPRTDSDQTETAQLFDPDVIAPIREWINQDITKVLLIGDETPLARLADEMTRRLAGEVQLMQTEGTLIQVMHPGVSKAVALGLVCRQLGIGRDETMAIGDNANDVGMLKWARIGVAVGNAVPAAIAAADYVTATNDADGVACAIQRIILDGHLPEGMEDTSGGH